MEVWYALRRKKEITICGPEIYVEISPLSTSKSNNVYRTSNNWSYKVPCRTTYVVLYLPI